MYEIRKNVPVAPHANTGHRRGGWKPIYPFADMEVGDSFIVPFEDRTPKNVMRHRISSAAMHRKKTHGGNFTVRTTNDGIAVWRTE